MFYKTVRFRRLRRHHGKCFTEARTFDDRIAELNWRDPELHQDINIGFPLRPSGINHHLRRKEWVKQRQEREFAARKCKLMIPLEDVKNTWLTERGSQHTHRIATHYGIFKHMFDEAFFYPITTLNVGYDYDEEFVTPVCSGNKINPAEAAVTPYVMYNSDQDSLWTLVMTSPDGNLQDSSQECLHWMVTNIPGDNVSQGEVICDYMQPFPPQGVGHLRYVFVLYKQNERLDLSDEKRAGKCLSLDKRMFNTLDFYSERQDVLTPAGLAFFQASWDNSVRSFFRQTLDMPEPVFQFIQPSSYHPRQVMYPHREPFNLYLDRYRDEKDINEEVLKESLKRISPFHANKPKSKYPALDYLPWNMPSWQKTRVRNMQIGRHQWKNIPGE